MSQKKILVAIAHYGTKNNRYIRKLIETYREMRYEISIVLLSNIERNYGEDIEVKIGFPLENPRSLPFAHRTLFKNRLNDFDYFIYTEDDTWVREKNVDAFIEATKVLPENEIAGFLRSETEENGTVHYSSCHSFFRWLPNSVRERGGKLWAEYTNQHSACYMATREQLKHAFDSKGLTLDPHEGRLGIQETAATDIYSSCHLTKVICIDNVSNFTLPHLPNAYIGKLGTPEHEINWQFETLRKCHKGEVSTRELFEPETLIPRRIGSKMFREKTDSKIQEMIAPDSQRIMIWGAGDGLFEEGLINGKNSVSVVAQNGVAENCCRNRGLTIHRDGDPQYDTLLLIDTLHLIENPESLLNELKQNLKSSGQIIIRVPNFHTIGLLRLRCFNPRFKGPWTGSRIGAEIFTHPKLRSLLGKSGFVDIRASSKPRKSFKLSNALTLGMLSSTFSHHLYIEGRKPST